MSGGIDSSVSAALLKRDGFDVIGVFMKFWRNARGDGLVRGWNRCCLPESERRARKVAGILKIPFYVFNFEKEFKKRIIDYFLKEYALGRTPNPCVVCNKEIKFGLLLDKALSLGADFIATGHYARIEIKNQKSKIRGFRLLKGKDKNKDQSYFLWQLNQKQLRHILFPVGNYTKASVKKLAKMFKLPVLGALESQQICFVKNTTADFLKNYFKKREGRIIDIATKKVIGKHQGIWFYTIGQRKGIELSSGPYYVLEKNLKNNLLIVTKNKKDLFKKNLVAKNINWISGRKPVLPLKVKAKIRYKHQSASALLVSDGKNSLKVIFEKPQWAVTPGQSIVFYDNIKNEEVLGGGIIN